MHDSITPPLPIRWLDAHRVCLNPGGQILFIPDAFEPFECTFIALFSEKKLFININVKEQ